MNPVIFIGRIINLFQRGMASFERLTDILEVQPEENQGPIDTSIQDVKGDIEFKNLTFTYPSSNEPALKNISIKIPRGKTLGVIGKTGCGKTTLVTLLLRLYNPQLGQLLVDGRDINSFPVEVLRESMGCVPQDNFLFSATIEQNIAFFRNIHTREEIEESAKISQVYKNIMDFPKGFKTMLGERGVNLSGGQKQRISIARALIKKPRILILDDALSAVDTKTEESILTNLRDVMEDTTAIIISHRISAVMEADEIVVLDKGEIIERGSHLELMDSGGLYHDIYIEQCKKQETEGLGYEAS